MVQIDMSIGLAVIGPKTKMGEWKQTAFNYRYEIIARER
jgi:hypothetical protein